MRRILSNRDLRLLSAAMAVMLFMAGTPLIAGVTVISGPGHPELSVDICHPLQSVDVVPGILMARPAAPLIESMLSEFGRNAGRSIAPPPELRVAPDTPPPKRAV